MESPLKSILKSFFKELIKKALEIKFICKKNPNSYNNGLLFGYYIILDTFRDEAISFGFNVGELYLNIDFEKELMGAVEEKIPKFPKTEIDDESLAYYLRDCFMIFEEYVDDYLNEDDEFSRGVLYAFKEMVVLFERLKIDNFVKIEEIKQKIC
ncbi:hypothetical protein JH146_1473 [Methanocaldococcus bathoardescens]|uniref:Uncharacterized protein n=1 Tax=Methanocaldococcus bathoardescens TaxID=1301915 RepID=A0A076LCT5_9EURY|nr:hypothetical protein [Methanocaldococcus bathoardescens]AIJ06315.1 hypothetical protein JH146_1473 [Methanocaldococcus bathoardescens]